MRREQIIGTWKSVGYTNGGMVRPYDRQELTFRPDGSGNMHAKTLFKRNTSITWDFDGFDFYIHNLGGPGSIAVASVDGDKLGVIENGMLMVYAKA